MVAPYGGIDRPVLAIEDGQALEPGRAYVLPNNGSLTIAGCRAIASG